CFRLAGLLALGMALTPLGPAAEPVIGPLISRIQGVGGEGSGNREAAGAWRELMRFGPEVLPDLLIALNDADPVAANWLRSAVDAIAEKAVAGRRPLPADRLEAFVKQTQNAGPARRLAYEWLCRVDPQAPERLLPGMRNDPGIEMRRDAIARAHRQARELLDKGDKTGATAALRDLFTAARERDQVDQLAKGLKELGVTVDVTAHFGFITQWMVIGPFDNSQGAGFKTVFPPEKQVDQQTTHEGKNGKEARWTAFRTPHVHGVVDLNKAVGKHMGAVAY